MNSEIWPSLPLSEWRDTYDTLHLWTQIVGKIKLALCPPENHWWQTTYSVSSRGLTTRSIPYQSKLFEIEFDFCDHRLKITTSEGQKASLKLEAKSVAAFYNEVTTLLDSLGIVVNINTLPQEIPHPIPFPQDHDHASYNPSYANAHWKILIQVDRLLKEFVSGFCGKHSPVHFFWGSFDLTCTLFSGRTAPERLGADLVTREAYSQEVASCGFWAGSGNVEGAAFYAYAAPEPEGYAQAEFRPQQAFYNPGTGGCILMYDEVRKSKNPDADVKSFFQSTYEACANLGHWDRDILERKNLYKDSQENSEAAQKAS